MYGRIFASMYEGSMVGAGSPVFAVMGYIIANMRPDDVVGAQVSINPKLLSVAIGDSEETIQKAIDFLCSPDANSTTEGEGGRRLVKIGTFAYRVVNGAKYIAIRKAEDLREASRQRKADQRAREKGQVITPHVVTAFTKPTLLDVKACMVERGMVQGEAQDLAERFVAHYESNGWKIGGKAAMKSWPAAVTTWLKNREGGNGSSQPARRQETSEEEDARALREAQE